MTMTKNVGPAKVWAAPTMQVVVMSAAQNETSFATADGHFQDMSGS